MILTRNDLTQPLYHGSFEASSNYQQRVLSENKKMYETKGRFDLFLSHSFLDKKEVTVLVDRFNICGYSVYVDWMFDDQLDRNNVTKETAEALRRRMKESRGLAYLATGNSASSKWCPWELGYFDGWSKNSRCCILPILTCRASVYKGQEYLGLYPYLQYEYYDFMVHEQDSGKYISLRFWLSGLNPKYN